MGRCNGETDCDDSSDELDCPDSNGDEYTETTILPELDATSGPEDCPETCPSNYDPVCGSDGNNYQNECYLKNIKCLENKPDLSVDFEGLWQYRLWSFKSRDTKLERKKIY